MSGRSRPIAVILASNTWGGTEIHTIALTAVLAARGHSCTIIELDQPQISRHRDRVAPGIALRTIEAGGVPSPFALYRILRKSGSEVCVFAKAWPKLGSMWSDLACWLASRGRFLTIEHLTPPVRPPKSTRRHFGGLVPGLGLWWYANGLKLYLRSVFPRRIVGVSRGVTGDLTRQYGFPARKVIAIPNGVDVTRYAPDPEARQRVRAQWGVPAGGVVYGAVGRFSNFHKGHDIAVELFARLCRDNPGAPLYCVLVGTGADEAPLRAQAEGTGYGDRIRFPGPTDRPWEAHCGLDVFLMPSRFEGIGLALLEAMACGVPPVAMMTGGIQDVMTSPDLGWSAPAGDREAFLRGMQAALDAGEAGRREAGRRAREHVVRHFEAGEQYGRLADEIEQL